MKWTRRVRNAALLIGGAGVLLQAGCVNTDFFQFLDTVFLGVTAAGSIAILQNI